MLKQPPRLDSTRSNRYQAPAQVDQVKFHFIQSARDNSSEHSDLNCFESDAERLEFIDSLLADNQYLCPVAECRRRWCTQPKCNGECVKCCKRMARVQFTSWQKQSAGLSTPNCIIMWIPAVTMMMDFSIVWFTTGSVIYLHHWSCLPAPSCAMLFCSDKGNRVFIGKLPSQSWLERDLIARTTSITRMMVVWTNPAHPQWVASC